MSRRPALTWSAVVGGVLAAAGVGCFIGKLVLQGVAQRVLPFILVLTLPVVCYLLGAWLRRIGAVAS